MNVQVFVFLSPKKFLIILCMIYFSPPHFKKSAGSCSRIFNLAGKKPSKEPFKKKRNGVCLNLQGGSRPRSNKIKEANHGVTSIAAPLFFNKTSRHLKENGIKIKLNELFCNGRSSRSLISRHHIRRLTIHYQMIQSAEIKQRQKGARALRYKKIKNVSMKLEFTRRFQSHENTFPCS